GLVPLSVCAGARVFFDETFAGNGRTCGTCHPAANNYTIDAQSIAALLPSDPLFVDQNPNFALSELEMPELRGPFALIRENVDGFQDKAHRFVGRAVPHTLSLATSLVRDPDDRTSAAFTQRTGWGGDGAPGDGSLRSFLDGAINQHYPRDLNRTVGTSFRAATNAERDQVLAFQLALGRTNELNLSQVTLTDSGAAAGKVAFMDPLVGRCNECHSNAGANARLSGKNANFNTGSMFFPSSASTLADGKVLFDAGFGGQNEAQPNLTPVGTPTGFGFGDGTFNVPPLIEAADTAPFFHSNSIGNQGDSTKGIEQAVTFYNTTQFLDSPAAKALNDRFGGQPINVVGSFVTIGRFLRVLNASFNLAIAKQRLDAARSLNIAYWSYRDDIQKGLLRLASEEIDDAIRVLQNAVDPSFNTVPLHAAQQTSLQDARSLLQQGAETSDPALRKARTESAITLVQNAKAAFGTNLNFTLGAGNLMF
ncbi:MAG: hypothetical protein ABUL60_13565, partial [Myxococcales bacterium]